VELLDGTKVPIKRRKAPTGRPDPSISAVCACPEGLTAQLKPARKTWVQPGTIAHVPVRSTYTGHGLVRGRPPLYHKHGLQVAQGPAIIMADEPITIQVMHLGVTPLRLTTDMSIGYIDAHEGPTYEVSESKLKELATPPKGGGGFTSAEGGCFFGAGGVVGARKGPPPKAFLPLGEKARHN